MLIQIEIVLSSSSSFNTSNSVFCSGLRRAPDRITPFFLYRSFASSASQKFPCSSNLPKFKRFRLLCISWRITLFSSNSGSSLSADSETVATVKILPRTIKNKLRSEISPLSVSPKKNEARQIYHRSQKWYESIPTTGENKIESSRVLVHIKVWGEAEGGRGQNHGYLRQVSIINNKNSEQKFQLRLKDIFFSSWLKLKHY